MKRLIEELEQIMELPPKEQVIIFTNDNACGDMDRMDQLEAAGAFQPVRI